MSKEKVIEYVMNSPYNTNRAVLEGLLDGMGEDEYTLLFEEEVTTAIEDAPFPMGNFSYNEYINADTIKVTFDGVEYQCDLKTIVGDSYYGDHDGTSGPNFSEYPFLIVSKSDGGNMIATQTPGTYTVKVEASQSNSSSSDWSTATVTFLNSSEDNTYSIKYAVVEPDAIRIQTATIPQGEFVEKLGRVLLGQLAVNIPLYKGSYHLTHDGIIDAIRRSGDTFEGKVTSLGTYEFMINGDCSITLTGAHVVGDEV